MGAANWSADSAADQAGRALDNLAHQLRSTGLSLEDVVSLEIHLVEPADDPAVDTAIEAHASALRSPPAAFSV